mmetsp:Transcript_92411/g.298686  ORF Transcript_92411/g.298686 Transcript_92411/m.298686 type:complete len:457 (-) Transcript_92411:454-1824(-)|eukprot:CAMPEP_0204133002 /NCGR_PEP_ID=MMETSP0361-20130328/14847_1 /ASSEMBLY_ACC=CAM_ASM_000343 /TAXON_ID=268821 /ORGANISM="Scrippsiella Hangoei, Strain SHTV-5" /LENGTH=456 /DNA_ID=CAMNT_0051085989 /DNA_START=50 /DNA_END=1420 /DNA_ORIENTATION=+
MAPGKSSRQGDVLKKHVALLEWSKSIRVKIPALHFKARHEMAVAGFGGRFSMSILKFLRLHTWQPFDMPCIEDVVKPGYECWVLPFAFEHAVVQAALCHEHCVVANGDQLQHKSHALGLTANSFLLCCLALSSWKAETNNRKLLNLFSPCFTVADEDQKIVIVSQPSNRNPERAVLTSRFRSFVAEQGLSAKDFECVSFNCISVTYAHAGPDAVVGGPASAEIATLSHRGPLGPLGQLPRSAAQRLLAFLCSGPGRCQASGELRLGDASHCPCRILRAAFPLVALNMRHNFGMSPVAVIQGGRGPSGVWVLPAMGDTVVRDGYRLVFLPFRGCLHGSQEANQSTSPPDRLAGPISMLAEGRPRGWVCIDPLTDCVFSTLWDLPVGLAMGFEQEPQRLADVAQNQNMLGGRDMKDVEGWHRQTWERVLSLPLHRVPLNRTCNPELNEEGEDNAMEFR